MNTESKTIVGGIEVVKETYVKHETNYFVFSVEWWKKKSVEHIANDLVIETDREIRNVYLNGVKIK